MPSVFKQLLQQSSAYAIGTILNRATNIILLPLYVRYLTKAEYGVLEILLLTSTVVMIVLQLGMGSALFRSILYKENDDRNAISSTAQYFLSLFSAAIIGILIIFSPHLAQNLFDSQEATYLLRILFLGDFFLVAATIPMSLLRIDQRIRVFVKISAANFVVGLGFNVLFLVWCKMGVKGIIWANTLTAAFFAIIYVYSNRKEWQMHFSFAHLRDMLGFGLPLVPSAIADLVLQASDRYILKYSRGFEELGDYSIAMRLAMIISLAVNAFQMAWPAVFFPLVKKPESKALFAQLFNYLMFFLLFATLILSVFAKEIIAVLATPSYLKAASILPLICVSFVFYSMYYYTSIGIQIKKKTHLFAILLVCSALINVVLNLLIIPRWGLIGAGFAKLTSNLFLGISIAYLSQPYYAIPYNYKALFKLGLTAIGIYILSQCFSSFSLYSYIFRFLLLLAFPVFLWLVKFFNNQEKAHLKAWWIGIFNKKKYEKNN